MATGRVESWLDLQKGEETLEFYKNPDGSVDVKGKMIFFRSVYHKPEGGPAELPEDFKTWEAEEPFEGAQKWGKVFLLQGGSYHERFVWNAVKVKLENIPALIDTL